MKRTTINVEIPALQKKGLRRIAAEYQVKISDVIRWAITSYLKSEAEQKALEAEREAERVGA